MPTKLVMACGRFPSGEPLGADASIAALLTSGSQIDRYVVGEQLGEGAMGRVYRAYDRRLQRNVALKVVTPGAGAQQHLASRLLREARAAAAFDHPHAVQVFDVGVVEGELYIAMELVIGHSLRAFVGREDITIERKVDWLTQVARALSAAHRAGLVHRDIKPDNVMVRDDGVVKVLDFGIAHMTRVDEADIADAPTVERFVDSPLGLAEAMGRLTAQGTIMGTPAYMAPEQLRGHAIDGRADQHAWGITAYELFVGDVPWPDGTLEALVSAVIHQSIDRVPASGLPPALSEAILRATRKRPEERFSSMEALLAHLDASRDAAPRKRSRLAWAAVALATGGLAAGVNHWQERRATATPAPSASSTASATSISAPPTESALELSSRARQLAYAGHLDEARRSFDQCLRQVPGAAACLEGRIWLNQDAGRCAEVERDARRRLRDEPEDRDAHRYLAEALFALGEPRASVERALAESRRGWPDERRPQVEALDEARLAILDGEFERALDALRRARGAPSSVSTSALRLEVWLLLEMGRTAEAGTRANRFLERGDAPSGGATDAAMAADPTVQLLRAALAGGQISRDTYEARRDAWVGAWERRAAADQRRHLWHHFYAAPTRDGEDAQDALDVSDRFAPRPRFHPLVPADAWMGRVDAWAGRYDRAVGHLDRAARSCEAIAHPLEHVQSAFALGRVHEAADRRQQACRAYARVIERWGRAKGSLTARGVRRQLADLTCDLSPEP